MLHEALKCDVGEPKYLDPATFFIKAKEFGTLFVQTTFEEDVTPYIHSKSHPDHYCHLPNVLRVRRLVSKFIWMKGEIMKGDGL